MGSHSGGGGGGRKKTKAWFPCDRFDHFHRPDLPPGRPWDDPGDPYDQSFPYDRKDPDRRDPSKISMIIIDHWNLRYFEVFGANSKMAAINSRFVLAAHLFITLAALRRRRALQESTISRPNVLVFFFSASSVDKLYLPPIFFQQLILSYFPHTHC